MNPHTNQGHTSYFNAKGASPCYGVGVRTKYISSSLAKTQKLGKKLAEEIIKKPLKKRAYVVGLVGELGSGKTAFLQGFAKGLRIKEKILSPTFIIMKRFKIQRLKSNIRYLIHIDCYRIKKPKEIMDLGFKKIISSPENIVVIEWADYIKKILPEDALMLEFEFTNEKKRKIIFKN